VADLERGKKPISKKKGTSGKEKAKKVADNKSAMTARTKGRVFLK